jgi:hypothetical protein
MTNRLPRRTSSGSMPVVAWLRGSNWIPISGKTPLPTIRNYGGTEEFWHKPWELPDVELVN